MNAIQTLLLITSIAILGLAPWLHSLAERSQIGQKIIYFTVIIGVGSIIGLHLLPETIEQIGGLAVVAALIGMSAPVIIEKLVQRASESTHTATLVLALIGLTLHGLTDGLAIAAPHNDELGLAVVIHRVPIAITVWMLCLPQFGERGGRLVLGLIALTTTLGFLIGESVHHLFHQPSIAFFTALVSGSLLHVILHRPHSHGDHSHDSHA